MKEAIWIVNKYVSPKIDGVFYPCLLKYTQQKLAEKNIQLSCVFFSSLFKNHVLNKANYFYHDDYTKLTGDALQKEAHRIEREYHFTFRQALFPDLLQASEYQYNHFMRKINLPECLVSELDELVKKFLYLENLIFEKKIDLVFCDQTPDVEMEFGRTICLRMKKPFIRQTRSFLGRNVFHQQFEFGKECILEAKFNDAFKIQEAITFVKDFIANKRLPYTYEEKHIAEKGTLVSRISKRYKEEKFIGTTRSALKSLKQRIRSSLYKAYFMLEQHVQKKMNEDKFDPLLPYFYFGFHMPSEATIALRALPYTNQMVVIEMISRVLPFGYYLYIREHPHWRSRFPAKYLALTKQYPNVRLISTKISSHTLIEHSQGIVTINGTMGIEGLMYGKPVLSLAPNVYYGFHPAVILCTDLYELGTDLAKLVNMKVNMEDTYKYIQKLFNISNDVDLDSFYYHSENHAREKAFRFAEHLLTALKCCKAH